MEASGGTIARIRDRRWQIFIFTCRCDDKRKEATRSAYALETPRPEWSLPTCPLEALDACRLTVEDDVLDDAVRRGYRRLERVNMKLPEYEAR